MKRRIIAFALYIGLLVPMAPSLAVAQNGINPAFFGTWCAQGDPNRRTSIVANGASVTLTNEHGLTSPGMSNGASGISAPIWNAQGALSTGQRTIRWTNGTFWKRCGHDTPAGTLSGTWYSQGRAGAPCSASQSYGTLTFRNEVGIVAHGSFTGNAQFTANWLGTPVTGTLRSDGRRIDWSNGTFWTRHPQN